jgi:hypothetical protein
MVNPIGDRHDEIVCHILAESEARSDSFVTPGKRAVGEKARNTVGDWNGTSRNSNLGALAV